MAKVFICGHRNPDMDSVAAAWSYSVLKNKLDEENTYIPVVLGPLNKIAQGLFDRLGLEPPRLIKDIYSRVSDVVRHPSLVLSADDPVYELMNMYNQSNPSVVPIMDDGEFKGLLSVDEITKYFLTENVGPRPVYNFRIQNIPRVLHGFFIKKPADMNLSFKAPLIVGAMKKDVFMKKLRESDMKSLLVVGCRKDHIEYAIQNQLPGIIITGVQEDSLEGIDFSPYNGFVYVSNKDTAETIRLLRLAVPVSDLLSKKEIPLIKEDMLFDTAKSILIDSGFRGLPVFDSSGEHFTGFITRRCFLDKPSQKMILVDHNEARQAVAGIEESDIIEIVDHHRLDAPKTRKPITIIASPVGSTCTIITDQFARYKVEIDPITAQVLLAGLMSDTVMLKSPTTTGFDRIIAERLCKVANVTMEDFCMKLFSDGDTLSRLDVMKVIGGDFKKYNELNVNFGIGQVEVTTLDDVDSVADKYIEALENVMRTERIDWAMLLVTDVIKDNSILFTTDYPKNYKFIYEERSKNVFNLPGVLSRKKQLLPEVIRVLSS